MTHDTGAHPGTGTGPAFYSGRAVVWGGVGVFAALAAVGFGLGRSQPSPLPISVTLIALAAAAAASIPLASRRAPLLLYAVLCMAGIAVICDARSANVGWLAVPLIGGWCGLIGGRRVSLTFLIAELALFTIEWVWIRPDAGWSAWLAASVLTFCLGMLLRHQFNLVEQLRATAQSELASKARAEERNRIARDLHDVIAHTLTVSLLHVMSARLAVEHDPADASRSLAEAETAVLLGIASPVRVRTAVGMLREDGDVEGLAPLPGMDGLPDLISRFQAAGVNVTLTTEGDVNRLPATVGLAVYRILQEALTNVVKHASGSAASVRLVMEPGTARLSVHSTGLPGSGSGPGHGLLSMRERAESLGGACTAGPDRRGWLVSATFPVTGSGQPSVTTPHPGEEAP